MWHRISKEEQLRLKKRIKIMRDRDKLVFRVIAERLGMTQQLVITAYYKW